MLKNWIKRRKMKMGKGYYSIISKRNFEFVLIGTPVNISFDLDSVADGLRTAMKYNVYEQANYDLTKTLDLISLLDELLEDPKKQINNTELINLIKNKISEIKPKI